MDQIKKTHEKLQKIYELTNCEKIDLPEVIIIGESNTGKSTILENILGINLLPKGSESHTKCPIELTILKKPNDAFHDWVEFQDTPDNLYTDYEAVKRKILKETENLTGFNGKISEKAICLKIYSNSLPLIKFVDLPGLEDNIINDNQLLKDITLKYIRKENAIILLVLAVNKEILNSEGLNIVKQVDPLGSRTLLVISKLDLFDPNNKEVYELLLGKVKPIKYNIIGVWNSRKITNFNNLTSKDLTSLMKHDPLITNKHGISKLTTNICNLFLYFLCERLAIIKDNIMISLRNYKQLLVNYGKPRLDLCGTLLELVSTFCEAYTSTILGPFKALEISELTGGARINYIFSEIFIKAVRSIDPLSDYNNASLLTAIRNTSGVKSTIFVPDKCFESLVKKQIKKLELPSLRCVELVYEEMENLIYNCGLTINSQLRRYPKLRQQIVSTILNLLKTRIKIAQYMVKQLIEIHTSYINTTHPDFIAQYGQINENLSNNTYKWSSSANNNHNLSLVALQSGDQKEEPYECVLIKRLITCYFNVIRTAIEDSVPKTIMCFLVNFIIDNIQPELISKLFINETPGADLMNESNEIICKRNQTIDTITNYEIAMDLISEITEILT